MAGSIEKRGENTYRLIVQWKEKNLAYDIYFTSMSTIGGFLAGTLGCKSCH